MFQPASIFNLYAEASLGDDFALGGVVVLVHPPRVGAFVADYGTDGRQVAQGFAGLDG